MNIIKYRYVKGFLLVLAILLVGLQIQGDDKELFMGGNLDANRIKANVVILMDNSGSMNTIIFYPKDGLDRIAGTSDDGFNPRTTYAGTVSGLTSDTNNLSSTSWYARWTGKTSATAEELANSTFYYNSKYYYTVCSTASLDGINFKVDSYSANLREGDIMLFKDTASPYMHAVVKLIRKYKVGSIYWIEVQTIYGGPIGSNTGVFQQSPVQNAWKPVVVKLYGTSDDGNPVRYPKNYVNWVFLHATDTMRKAISYFSTYGTFVDTGTPPATQISYCATPGNDNLGGSNPRIKQTFTRIQTAREVVCNVTTNSNEIVKLGLFTFNTQGNGDDGGELQQGLGDMSDESSDLVSYKNNVWGVTATTWTPLAETLADIWFYYKPGPASKSYWPVDYEIANGTVNHSTTNPVTPIDFWCQNNYVVIMTDGESTMDRFDNTTKYGNGKSIFLSTSSPVKRQNPWSTWTNGWGDFDSNDIKNSGYIPANYNPSTATYCPNYTCWLSNSGGSDLLDDVAYFLRHQDMFPDNYFVDGATGTVLWPGEQHIFTYTIGFTADNDMLLQTAINGDGAYYTANNYDELVNAFQLVITSINLRNFAFSAITAPKKTATATNAEQTVSYVGYLVPSIASSIWEGHLLSYKLIDKWGYDVDGDGEITPEEYLERFKTQESCLKESNGLPCYRSVKLNVGHEWDAADEIPTDRSLFTTTSGNNLLAFTLANRDQLRELIDSSLSDEDTEKIITTIRTPKFADVFHADVGFVGIPPYGKRYVTNIAPPGENDESYETFWDAQQNRTKVIYTGTNDGILHMILADGVDAGKEVWGYLPPAILPSLRPIVIDNAHTYTVDGRLTAQDVWFQQGGNSINTWATLLTFGLRSGGNSYHTLDITNVGETPTLLWDFEDSTYSGESWSKPVFGRVKFQSGGVVEDKWVVFVTGGFAFNSENPNDSKGKSLFMLDVADGSVLWMIGYNAASGAASPVNPSAVLQTVVFADAGNNYYLTKSPLFNFSFPAALTAVDKDNDGYTDTLYFGNVGGHLFKTDISGLERADWPTYVIYERRWITDRASSTISTIGLPDSYNNRIIKVASVNNFQVGYSVMGKTSYACGYIKEIDSPKKELTVAVQSGTFLVNETLASRTYDPIYLAPAIFYDRCYQLWITFGTGDRDRPMSNVINGRFIGIRDNGTSNIIEGTTGSATSATLQYITFGNGGNEDEMEETTLVNNPNGWYFNFSPGDNGVLYGEKLFDPEPVVLPDQDLVPHLYFNTYQPPVPIGAHTTVNCDTPKEGTMTVYDISIKNCGNLQSISGSRTTGRIAGGGIYEGKEYVIYKSTSGNVADVPGGEGGEFLSDMKRLPFSGGIIYWKEKRR